MGADRDLRGTLTGWREVRLEEIADINPESLGVGTPQDFSFRYIDLSAVERGNVNWAEVGWQVYKSSPSRARRVVEPGDVLFGTVRPALQSHGYVVAQGSTSMVASTGFAVVRARSGLSDSRFLFYVILGPAIASEARKMEVGSNYPAVNESDVKRFTVECPPLPEQRAIAAILDTLDSAIRQTEQVIAKLKLMKQGLLHDLLTRGIDENGELRPPPEEAPHLYKKSPLGMVPREWEARQVSEVCREIVVGIVIRPTQYYTSGGVPVLRSANVREDGVDLADLVFMSKADHRIMAKSAVRPGDLVTVRTGYPGTTAVVPNQLAEANCVDIIISRTGPAAVPEFLATWVNSDFGKGQVLKNQGGLAQQHFNVGEMKKLLVAVPPLEEQRILGSAVESLDRRMGREMTQQAKLKSCKSGLMDDLLTGRVRVKAG